MSCLNLDSEDGVEVRVGSECLKLLSVSSVITQYGELVVNTGEKLVTLEK